MCVYIYIYMFYMYMFIYMYIQFELDVPSSVSKVSFSSIRALCCKPPYNPHLLALPDYNWTVQFKAIALLQRTAGAPDSQLHGPQP